MRGTCRQVWNSVKGIPQKDTLDDAVAVYICMLSFVVSHLSFNFLRLLLLHSKCWEFLTKKIIPRKTEQKERMVISYGIPTVLLNRKLSEFRLEPFRGRENNWEFRSVDQK